MVTLSRIIGAVILVPVIEELFFRGYLLRRLDRGGAAMCALALLVSAAAFAILHDRWLAAGLAGLVFGLVMLRQGKLSAAVAAHASANALIVFWAVAMNDWSVM
jgi:exosortase E/protease (VPEID-CTERM system)